MDSKPLQICRLCLQTSEGAINIRETFDESPIASILAKHFWFQVPDNDGLTEWLCQLCWIPTKTFHEFYKTVERYHTDLLDDYVEKDECADPDESIDANFEPYLNLVKCEAELILPLTDSHISQDDISHYSDYQSATEHVSTNQAPIKKRKIDDDILQSSSPSENEIPTDQIRELFTMKCDICKNVEFESLRDAESHYRKIHKKKGYLMCCDRKFFVLQKILEHIEFHPSIGAVQSLIKEENDENDCIGEFFSMKCEICNDVEFETFGEARQHYPEVHKTSGFLMCCDRKFLEQQEIWDHIQFHQSNPACRSQKAEEIDRISECFTMECEICSDVEFASFWAAKSHYRNIHKKKGYLMCCDRKFFVLQKIMEHLQFHQSNPAVQSQIEEENDRIREFFDMKCEICNDVEFETFQDAKSHYRKDHKKKGYLMCCRVQFFERPRLLDHIQFHQSNVASRSKKAEENDRIREFFAMKCEICKDVEFESFRDAESHYLSSHNQKGYLMCCGRKFFVIQKILDHIQFHQSNEENDPDTFRCDQCSKRFSNKETLKLHIDNHVPLDSRVYKCTLCSRSFKKGHLLNKHVKSKHESKTGEILPCEKCGQNFPSKILLASHVRQVHEYSLKHVCETCAQRFKNKRSLAKHVLDQHSTTPQPKVQCEICGIWLKHKLALQKHISLMHQDIPKDVVVKDLKCPRCDKRAATKNALKCHVRSVHGEKRHLCPMCGKAFHRAKNLKEHVALHTGENLYNCPYCEKTFRASANMYTHRKKEHFAEWTRDCSLGNGFIKNVTLEVT